MRKFLLEHVGNQHLTSTLQSGLPFAILLDAIIQLGSRMLLSLISYVFYLMKNV